MYVSISIHIHMNVNTHEEILIYLYFKIGRSTKRFVLLEFI